MDRLKRTFSFRKKKSHGNSESSKPHQWQEDERKVRDGTCSFQVRYLGCIQVFDSRGIQVCEEAVKALKAQCKGKYQRAILHVSGDALRVTDEISKGLLVDQTIEKVSFCAPDRNHEKGFAYICRDATSRRWMCHAFLAVKESGERLSHAVGCAFAICLEKKQKREKEAVDVKYNEKGTSFTRMGSFRQTTLTERMLDPQSAIIPEPVEASASGATPSASAPVASIERPRASEEMLQRQASFRGFSKIAENSPFKRNWSLRPGQLPSTVERQQQLRNMGQSFPPVGNTTGVEPIAEVSPSKEHDDLSSLCQKIQTFAGHSEQGHDFLQLQQQQQQQQQLQELQQQQQLQQQQYDSPAAASNGPPAGRNIPGTVAHSASQPQGALAFPPPVGNAAFSSPTVALQSNTGVNMQNNTGPSNNIPTTASSSADNSLNGALAGVQPIVHSNPWETPPAFRKHSAADSWLDSMATSLATTPAPHTAAQAQTSTANGWGEGNRRAPPALGQLRSQTVDSPWGLAQPQAPTLAQLQQQNRTNFASTTTTTTAVVHNGATGTTNPWGSPPNMLGPTTLDPFDAQWASSTPANKQGPQGNPFQTTTDTGVSQTFKLQL